MNSLPGNPYVGEPDGDGVIDAVVFSADDSPMQATEILLDQLKDATLALAFEKRTESIIALAALCTANGRKELGQPFIDLVMERIGIDGDDA